MANPTEIAERVETAEVGERKANEQLAADTDVVVSDLLVEEVSIDGMCGVY